MHSGNNPAGMRNHRAEMINWEDMPISDREIHRSVQSATLQRDYDASRTASCTCFIRGSCSTGYLVVREKQAINWICHKVSRNNEQIQFQPKYLDSASLAFCVPLSCFVLSQKLNQNRLRQFGHGLCMSDARLPRRMLVPEAANDWRWLETMGDIDDMAECRSQFSYSTCYFVINL